MKFKRTVTMILALLIAASSYGCGAKTESGAAEDVSAGAAAGIQTASTETQTGSVQYTANANGILDVSELFTDRDLRQTADLSESTALTVSDGDSISITQEGVYVISGTAENCTITVDAGEDAKVQLVLDNVSITNSDAPAVYVLSADKCFITSAEGESRLSVTGVFVADDSADADAVIFSKDDIVLNGAGTLDIVSDSGNGISSNDDVKITGGTYNITAAGHGIEANDSVSVYDGNFTIEAQKDAFHSANDEDDSLGWIYICGGSFDLTVGSDAIHANSVARIDGGSFEIIAPEGIEGTYVQINGGTISITSSDDGINATAKSSKYDVVVEFNGGDTTIVMGQGDTDAVDANGSIYVNGGTINITAPTSSFDYDNTAQLNGGTVIINGTQVTEIPQPMMGGRGGMGGMRGGMGGGRGMANPM